MLVGTAASTRTKWKRGFVASAAVLVLAIASISPHLTNSMELVRMRNALLIKANPTADFAWAPTALPADFKAERGAPDPHFSKIVGDLHLESLPSDWDRAVALAQVLRSHADSGSGGPIQSNLEDTYQRIVTKGEGYCGDYVRVYTALALAAKIPVRSWAFSFDGFGGHGHIFNEVWDSSENQWRMIDVFNNYYFVQADGAPLSALAFRTALMNGAPDLRLLAVEPRSQPGFIIPRKAWDYYRRGLPEWYMWWGNNVFSYDRDPLVETMGSLSRSLEELGGIVDGVHPAINVLQTADNRAAFESMERLRTRLIAALVAAIAAVAGMAVAAVGWWRADRTGAGGASRANATAASAVTSD